MSGFNFQPSVLALPSSDIVGPLRLQREMLGNARPTVLSLDHPLGVTTGAWLSSFNVWSGPGGQISSRPSEREGGSRGEVTGRRGFLALPWASSVTLAKSLSCFVPQFPICLMRVIMHWKMVRSLSSTERKCYPGNGHRYLFGGRAIKPSEAKGNRSHTHDHASSRGHPLAISTGRLSSPPSALVKGQDLGMGISKQ